jgi:hypothetical protein
MKRLVTLLFVITGCAEAEEARLDHAQILAVRLDPPQVAPGAKARVDILAGDDHGNVFESAPTTLDAGGLPVEQTIDGWFVTAPATPGIVPLAVTLEIDGGSWSASKQLVVAEQGENPRVETMQIDGQSADGELVLAKGTKPKLAAAGTGESLRHAWYSSVGDLKFYRQPEAELDAATTGEGLVVVVVRDDRGGVGWHIALARVE